MGGSENICKQKKKKEVNEVCPISIKSEREYFKPTGVFEILSSKKKEGFLDSSETRTDDPWQMRANALLNELYIRG